MLTVITWLWGHKYRPAHVQRLRQSVGQWLTVPHRFVCITDLKVSGVETMPNPAPQYSARCYRRLWMFSAEAARLGERLLHLDLDVVVCGSLDPLVQRGRDFTIYKAGSIAARGYSLNPSVFALNTVTQTDIWERFQRAPMKLSMASNRDGFWGSDQAVISHLRKDAEVDTIGDAEGVVSFRRIKNEQLTAPPAGTRIVSFHGKRTPFEPEIQRLHPWILEAWQVAA
jgi:hypothetical protein